MGRATEGVLLLEVGAGGRRLRRGLHGAGVGGGSGEYGVLEPSVAGETGDSVVADSLCRQLAAGLVLEDRRRSRVVTQRAERGVRRGNNGHRITFTWAAAAIHS